jgi:outer membrane protein assembly factor BamE (lipoprotein component of BamABCDE complex)
LSRKLKYGILTIGLLILIGFALKGRVTYEKFDSEKWKNWTESETEWSLRWEMMNSLRSNYDLKGMSKNEILKLLGEPESKTENEFGYYLGNSKRGINTGRLTIKFDNNKVTDFSVWDG